MLFDRSWTILTRNCLELLKFLYDLFHAGPHSSIFFNTPQYQPTKLPVCDKSHLLLTTFQNRNISCAHFTEEDAKAVNINLNEKKMHSSTFPENKLTLPKSIPHSPKFSCTWTTCRKTPISVHHLGKKNQVKKSPWNQNYSRTFLRLETTPTVCVCKDAVFEGFAKLSRFQCRMQTLRWRGGGGAVSKTIFFGPSGLSLVYK